MLPPDASLLAGLGLGLLLALQLSIWCDDPKGGDMSALSSLPQPLLDALTSTVNAKATADAAATSDAAADQALAAAQGQKTQTAAAVTTAGSDLNAARAALEAVEDAYFQPGASAPASPTPSANASQPSPAAAGDASAPPAAAARQA